MSFSFIKDFTYKQALKKRKQQNKVTPKPFNFAQSKTFAFLIDISESRPGLVQKALAFAEKLRKKGKEVVIMAYTDALQKPEGLEFGCFCKKDLKNAVPKGEAIDAFFAKSYDVLIDFYMHECQPLDFLLTAAPANFRIGYYKANRTNYYDLMVHNPDNNIDTMILQIESAMAVINKV